MILRGQCAACHAAISLRYPFIELLTACLSLVVALHFGVSMQAMAVLLLTYLLIALTFIDLEHQILPDGPTLGLLWLGLLVSIPAWFIDSSFAIISAAGSYTLLWLLAYIFQRITGKQGMGHGDFKLLAALGAWLGWKLNLLVILFASFIGAICGILVLLIKKQGKDTPLPFGPYLAVAGWCTLLWGQDILHFYLTYL